MPNTCMPNTVLIRIQDDLERFRPLDLSRKMLSTISFRKYAEVIVAAGAASLPRKSSADIRLSLGKTSRSRR